MEDSLDNKAASYIQKYLLLHLQKRNFTHSGKDGLVQLNEGILPCEGNPAIMSLELVWSADSGIQTKCEWSDSPK